MHLIIQVTYIHFTAGHLEILSYHVFISFAKKRLFQTDKKFRSGMQLTESNDALKTLMDLLLLVKNAANVLTELCIVNLLLH